MFLLGMVEEKKQEGLHSATLHHRFAYSCGLLLHFIFFYKICFFHSACTKLSCVFGGRVHVLEQDNARKLMIKN